MIRVLHILTDSNIGGAGRYLVNYLRCRNQAEFEISVVLPRASLLIPEITVQGVPVTEVDGIAEKSFSRAAIKSLSAVIRREKPDIVHTHGSLSGRIAGKRCGAKVIYTRHSAFPVPGYLKKGPGHALYGAFTCHYADHIIAVSPAAAENLTDSGVPTGKITTLLNGAEALTPAAPERQTALRTALGIPEGVFTAGILARLEPYKGHLLLLEAAKALKAEGRDFRILIGGGGSEERHIRETIQDMAIQDRVLFLGFVENVSEVLSLLDVQLNCSYGTECSSLALIEGMSLGLATIASDYGGNPWMVEDGVTGLLFPTGDSGALADRLRRLMDAPDELAAMRRGARTAYAEKFTGEIFANNIESVYRQVLSKSEA